VVYTYSAINFALRQRKSSESFKTSMGFGAVENFGFVVISVVALVGTGALAWSAHQQLARIEHSTVMQDFELGRCKIEAVKHSTQWDPAQSEKYHADATALATCWDRYKYQFSILHPASAKTAAASPLTSGEEYQMRKQISQWITIPFVDFGQCPEHAADVVPSNLTKGQETQCWIPKKLPIDESVWGPCANPECVELFPPGKSSIWVESLHDKVVDHLWNYMVFMVMALLATLFCCFLLCVNCCCDNPTDEVGWRPVATRNDSGNWLLQHETV
jgi:hypothetical protein